MNIMYLAWNEFKKITFRKSTIISLAILASIVMFTGLIMKNVLPDTNENGWKQQLLEEKKQEEAEKTTETTGLYYSPDVKNKDYYLQHNINPYEWNTWRFTSTVTSNGLEIFVSLAAVLTVSGIVSQEFSLGTIKFIATTPNRRWRILTSKFLASLFFTVMIFIFYAVSCLSIGGILFGFDNASYPLLYTSLDDQLYTVGSVSSAWTVLLLRFITVIMITTIAFTLSVLLRNQSLSLCLSILLLFGSSILGGTDMLSQYAWYKFTLFPHLNLVAYLNKSAGVAIANLSIPFSLIILSVYFLLFIAISFYVFQKREIAT
ncbi:ABC transporter permease subunit [Bacillus sp. C28GYM-DRY-1]|uniref:ABC transporter permease subunit n=1 Tax=Bacillus sp. C28GYM-DRY-1 TaxID=3062686 RepID=UPI00267763E7|nr:ABC transporter permease subunit [Bacillus sp. C28GYM-DRY-1]MDO3662399.1 ABC transporter permease subunit [Bacillus sp. C28GYM-DRY-1]